MSHSSRDVALTRAVCQELSSANPAGGPFETAVAIDILADYARLQDGAPWPKQLHEWLARSHAGLILLTENALASDWVLKEATILTWRQSLEKGFLVFIACDKAVITGEKLKAYRYSPLSLPSIQWVDSLDAATIATHVRHAIGPAPPRTLFDQLVGYLTDLMTDTVKPNTMKVLAERLRVQAPAWDPNRDERAQYLEEIARRLLSESLGGFNGVNELIAELARTVHAEPLNAILNFVAPYWVDAEVAGRLRALNGRTPPRAAALNASEPLHSGLMHVSRAHNMGLDYLISDIAGGDHGQTAKDISAQIVQWCRTRGDIAKEKDSDEAVKKALMESLIPVYAVLPERIDPDVLDELRDEFKSVVFVMSRGPQLDEDARFRDVDWLKPALDAAIEKREQTSYSTAVQIINNKRGRR